MATVYSNGEVLKKRTTSFRHTEELRRMPSKREKLYSVMVKKA